MKTVVGLVALLLVALAPSAASAAGPEVRMPHVGLLRAIRTPHVEDAFRQGLRELGYIDGQTIAIEYRWADGKYDRLPALAAELVRLKVDVIVAGGTPAALAAKNATQTIPIVFPSVADPVASRRG